MKRLLLPLLLLLAVPLSAQNWEVGIHGYAQEYATATIINPVEPQQTTAWAGRLGYSIVDFGPCQLQLNAFYAPNVDADVKVAGVTDPTKLSHEYVGAGVMFNFKAFIAFGAGLDYRSEKLGAGTTSTTYGRGWARANVGFAFPFPVVKPFIMVEVAAPLSKTDYNGGNQEEALKSLAPKMQVGIYAGIRF